MLTLDFLSYRDCCVQGATAFTRQKHGKSQGSATEGAVLSGRRYQVSGVTAWTISWAYFNASLIEEVK